jgi:hypothetical protein
VLEVKVDGFGARFGREIRCVIRQSQESRFRTDVKKRRNSLIGVPRFNNSAM